MSNHWTVLIEFGGVLKVVIMYSMSTMLIIYLTAIGTGWKELDFRHYTV